MMNCLTCRRLLLSSPREQTVEQRTHIARCAACARLSAAVAALDLNVENAAMVRVPDGLVDRVLLTRRPRPISRYAAVAAVLIAIGGSALLQSDVVDHAIEQNPVLAVGPSHPAVAAISLVKDGRFELAQSGNTAEMNHVLKELGLALQPGSVNAYYAGKCQLPGRACDLIVLDAPDARANVIIVPNYPDLDGALVEDRQMTALVSPAKAGGYIVVADSPKVAKRMKRLFRRG